MAVLMNSPIQKTPVKLDIFITYGMNCFIKITHDNTKFCNGIKFSFGQFVFLFVILCSLLLSLKCVPNYHHGGAKEVHIGALHDLKKNSC